MIFSTSITKGINVKDFNQDYVNGTAEFQLFRGKKANHIKNYMKSHVELEKPDRVVIHMGGNDLPSGPNMSPMPIDELANHIIEAGEICSRSGVREVFIAGVTSRPGLQKRCFSLNDRLEEMCGRRNFTFIKNENISLSHLYDGVHLSKAGSRILQSNYLRALDNGSGRY